MTQSTNDGNNIFCAWCCKAYSGHDKGKGFVFGITVCCPNCDERITKLIAKGPLEGMRHIKRCPKDMSFWQWVLSLRVDNNPVRESQGVS